MPSVSASQQRLFGMVYAYKQGKLNHAPKLVKRLAEQMSDEDVEHFARTKHDGLPEKSSKSDKAEKKAEFLYSLIKAAKDKARKREEYTEGEGRVLDFTPSKTKNHDEIVLVTKDGRVLRISNNTLLGKLKKYSKGDKVSFHGYKIKNTNIVHKVHPNTHSRGGWIETIKSIESNTPIKDIRDIEVTKEAESQKVVIEIKNKQYEFPSIKAAAAYLVSFGRIKLSVIREALAERQPIINGLNIYYPDREGNISDSLSEYSIDGEEDIENNGITFKLPKSYIPSSYGL